MSCEFSHDDGPYVLGALSPVDRQEFERHLADCAECARAVRDLAGLPGLLARVDVDVLELPPVAEPVAETLLPALFHEVRRTQRRRAFVAAALAAVAVVAVAVGSVALVNDQDAARPDANISFPAGAVMTAVRQQQMSASLAFETVAWGTRLDLTCSYVAGEYGRPASTYALFVNTRDGRTEQVATWGSLPGKTMRLVAATAAHRKDIKSVEIRTSDGRPVLKMTT